MSKVRSREIWVTGRFVALHRWKDCPYEQVAFLRDWHRHEFHVKVTLTVEHDDRDLEFFMVKNSLTHVLNMLQVNEKHDKSCEMFAESIANSLNGMIGREVVTAVEVSEDGENGAIVYFDSEER